MLNTNLIKSFTDLRQDPARLARLATSDGPVYILNRNNPVSVLIDVSQYEAMVEELQDSRDSLWLKKNEAKFKKSQGLTDTAIRAKYHLSK